MYKGKFSKLVMDHSFPLH